MREKELRLALVCYGGISLAVYMHGITKEVWRLARASRALHAGEAGPGESSEPVYRRLLETVREAGLDLGVLVDIVTGASAGGINGIFLAQAIASGQSLEPLTALWLERADVEVLLDPQARPGSRLAKLWATPIAWAAGRSSETIEQTVDAAARAEVRAKLGQFVRARWFEPPFGGAQFLGLLIDALDAMAAAPAGPPLLPPTQPLDLIVTVTDFGGHPERLRLNSPEEVVETEHRLVIGFTAPGTAPGADPPPRTLGDAIELAFAGRATASFPGAFPPFMLAELDGVLAERGLRWPGRDAFLARVLPRHTAAGAAGSAALIDGSVLANAPFRPAIDALKDRPARREIDRRFVYIDPKPGRHSVSLSGQPGEAPGFFATILGALSDIPREQPIRDNLEAIEARSGRIERMRAIVGAIEPQVEAAITQALGSTFFLANPTPARLAAWRTRANASAARAAGYAYAPYGFLKLGGIVDELAATLCTLLPPLERPPLETLRRALGEAVAAAGVSEGPAGDDGAPAALIAFYRNHDLGFRIRRLRFLARRLARIETAETRAPVQALRAALYEALAPYLERERPGFYDESCRAAARIARERPQAALDWIAEARGLKAIDDRCDALLAAALAHLPRAARRAMLLAYLGYPFYDIATLPLLQGEGLDEFDPVKVDRIAPEDARSIRAGGAEATLKGIQFNSFGAFFSRAYRENDYLWGRLHGAERLVDIVLSTLPEGASPPAGAAAALKHELFRAILAEERERLTAIPELFETLDKEVG